MSSSGSVATPAPRGSRFSSPTDDAPEDNLTRLTTYLHNLAGYTDVEVDTILKDHCYARPWNWRPENIYVKPTRKLFFSTPHESWENTNQEEIDVVDGCNDTSEEASLPYDFTRCRQYMEESQKLANFARPDENSDDWEEKVEKTFWSPMQRRLFTRIYNVLSAERLARLAKTNCPIEPVFRRTSTDTATKRYREILASTAWDWRIIQWLHGLLIDNLPRDYLVIYLDILQSLRMKIPQLVDRMIAVQPNVIVKAGSIPAESLSALLKRPWDPVATCLNTNRPKKLPGNPILIIVPSEIGATVSARQHKWISQLGALGMVVNVHSYLGLSATRMTMMTCMDQLIQATRAKIQDVRGDCPGRPMILVGFNTGAALACQVAQMEHVTAVICLGFPFSTVEGKRGSCDDMLMDIRCPVMFIIGQNANLVRSDDLEDLRSKMLVETSLVVVGTADDQLRISTTKKISEGITQSMVDRCVLDEIGDFIGSILLQPHPLPLRSTAVSQTFDKSVKRESRKRKNSTSSSVESESNFPIDKKLRPTTPINSTVMASSQSSMAITKSAILTTQPTLVAVGSPAISQSCVPTQKRKPRVQQNSNPTNGGFTLNIGSLASLAPMGPIRLTPNSTNQSTVKSNNISKSPIIYTKGPKMIQTSNLSGKIRTASKSIATNNSYKSMNMQDKTGSFSTGPDGSHDKITTSTSSATQTHGRGSSPGPLTALLHSRKSNVFNSGSVIDDTNSTITNEIQSNPSNASNVDNGMSVSPASATKVMKESTSNSMIINNTMGVDENSSSTGQTMKYPVEETNKIVSPITIIPWSSKINDIEKYVHEPAITKIDHHCTISKKHRGKSQALSLTDNGTTSAINLDDDIGNILDIPIIFAKDDESLNAIEKLSSVPLSVAITSGVNEQNITTKASPTTRVVLLSNKEDKVHRALTKVTHKVHEPMLNSCDNVNQHVILQTRKQISPVISTVDLNADGSLRTTARPVNQSAIKYTKIILSKRNLSNTANTGDQVILTKQTRKLPTSQILTTNTCQPRYRQLPIKIASITQNNNNQNIFETDNVIKVKSIEKKSNTEIDLIDKDKHVQMSSTKMPTNLSI